MLMKDNYLPTHEGGSRTGKSQKPQPPALATHQKQQQTNDDYQNC